MPTTAEIEARLRQTAAACEPIVEDLLDTPPTPVIVPLARRAHRGPRRGVRLALVAAALLLVVALGAVAVLAGRDEPDPGVRADVGVAPPAPIGGEPIAQHTEVLLADGTRVDLELPDPDAWTVAGAQLGVQLDGVSGSVVVDIDQATLAHVVENAGAGAAADEVAAGAHLVSGGDYTTLALERDGWMLTVTAVDAGELPADVVAALAADLQVTTTDAGPVDLVAPGLTVTRVLRWVELDGPLSAESSTLQVEPTCPAEPTAGVPERCIDGIRVVAYGPVAEEVLPELALTVLGERIEGEEEATGVLLTVPFADGTRAELTLPGDEGWAVAASHALVDLGDGVERTVRFTPETREGWAARSGLTLTDGEGEGTSYASAAPTRWLLVERSGWTAALALTGESAVEAGGAVPDERVAALARALTFQVVDGAPTALAAPDLGIDGVGVELRRPGAADDALLLQVGAGAPDACGEPTTQTACFADGELVVTGLGAAGQATLAGMGAELLG